MWNYFSQKVKTHSGMNSQMDSQCANILSSFGFPIFAYASCEEYCMKRVRTDQMISICDRLKKPTQTNLIRSSDVRPCQVTRYKSNYMLMLVRDNNDY